MAKRAAGQQFGGKPRGKFGGRGQTKGPQAWQQRAKFFAPGETPMRIRFVPTTPDDAYYLYYNRWCENKTLNPPKRRMVISNSQNGQLDVPDMVFWHAVEMGNDPKLLASPAYAVTVVLLETFHKVEKQSKAGNPYSDYIRCGGLNRFGKPACELCAQKVETVFGQQRYWALSNAMREELERELSDLPHRCAGCYAGYLVTYAYDCPACGKEIANRYDADLSDEDIDTLEKHGVDCPHCDKGVMPTQRKECAVQVGSTSQKGCSSPKEAPKVDSLFGYDITIAATKKDNSTTLKVTSFSAPAKVELPGYMLRPMPFEQFMSHMTLHEQSLAMGIANPFGDEGEQLVARFFSKPVQATPSAATSEEADEQSINWGA